MAVSLGLLLGFRRGAGSGVLAAIELLLVFAFTLGRIWTFLALELRTLNAVMGWRMLVITPLSFGSNIVVDPSTMPGWLQAFVSVDPISHLVDGVRGLMHGEAEVVDVLLVFGWAAALVAVLGPLTMRRYANRA